MNFKAIILAAGKGTRMKSKYPKVVHKVCGKEMVNHVISVSKKSGVNDIVAILGHESDVVKEKLPKDTMIAMQTEQLGTGHAVMMAKEYINDNDTIVVLCGDTPLVKEETLKRLSKKSSLLIIYAVNMLFSITTIFYVLGSRKEVIFCYIILVFIVLFLIFKTNIIFDNEKK